MKKILLLLLMIPVWGFAQTASKYLAGAVPVVDGKVTFTQTINVPGASKEAIYNMVNNWAKEQFETTEDFPNNKLITENAQDGEIGAIGEEYIVFTSSALSLDRTRIYYQFLVQCETGKCNLTMTRIRYWYNESRDGGERYNAEDIITDENGLNKSKTKLARVIGKFRSKTIDYKDNLFKSVANSIIEQLQKPATAAVSKEETKKEEDKTSPSVITIDLPNSTSAVQVSEPVKNTKATESISAAATLGGTVAAVAAVPTITVKASDVTVSSTGSSQALSATAATTGSSMEGYKKIAPENIPGNIYKMLSQDWMLITAGNDEKFNMMTASWGGLGNLYQKPVAFCFINPSRYTYQLMEKNDTYTLTFYNESSREALKVCGSQSGKNTDKVKASGLTPLTTPSGNKAFKEAWLIIECKKMVAQSLNPEALKEEALKQEWEGKAMHKMYIGEIVNVWMK